MIRKKKYDNRQQIVSEYLTGNETFAVLAKKYDVNARTIQSWVRAFRKRSSPPISPIEPEQSVKELQKQLKEQKLKNELLEEMLRLSEEQTGIDFRKKYGTKQS